MYLEKSKKEIEPMKNIYCFLFSLALCISTTGVKAAQIVLEGNYQGKNLYISNPYAASGVGFCVFEVYVNDQLTTDEWNSNAFEIDLTDHELKKGDKVTVKIKHKDDCKPKVINPEVLKPKSTFEVVSMKVERDGTMNIVTKNEGGKLNFTVEQKRWNKWVKVGEINGKGSDEENSYSLKVTPHSGENLYRLKQIDFSSQPRYSEQIKFRSMSPEVTFSPTNKVDKEIKFSAETLYEVWDQFGNIQKKGFGAKIDLSGLTKGIYFLNFDTKTEKFTKK